ncbi:MAG: DMT family transporter [Phycisphaerales bacterium]|nr:DMT family transporter [Phycisphaerales bacterium]
MRVSVPVADGFLFVCALLWGIGFVAQRIAALDMGDTPFTYNAARFLLGALLLLPFALRRPAARSQAVIIGGSAAALAMFAASSLQQMAMARVTPGTAGFITGTYVIWVPLLGLLWGQRVSRRVWAGAAIALVGMWFLMVRGRLEIAPDELLLLACAVGWAAHVHIIGWAALRGDVLGIAFVQFAVTGALSGAVAFAAEPVSLEILAAGWWPIAFSGFFAITIAFTLQVLAQTAAPPAHAAIILSMESLFAEISGSIWMRESFDPRKWVGATLMLTGALVATVTGLRRSPPESTHPQEPAAG